jgi:hypothetical protein
VSDERNEPRHDPRPRAAEPPDAEAPGADDAGPDAIDRWQRANDEYLSKALVWLRRLLEQRIEETAGEPGRPAASAAAGEDEPEEAGGRAGGLFGRRRPRRLELPAAASGTGDDARTRTVAAAAAAMKAAEEHEPPPALVLLARRLGLSRFDREVLLLTAAMELDTRIADLCGRAQGSGSRAYPTFALALALLDEPSWDVLSPERPLRYWRLIEITQPGAQPLTASALRADERIVNYLKGLNYLDDRLAPLVVPLHADAEPGFGVDLPPSQRAVVDELQRYLQEGLTRSRPPLVQLLGADDASKRLVAVHATRELGVQLFRLPAALLPGESTELDNLARLWQREGSLLPLALYVDAGDSDEAQLGARLSGFLSRCRTMVFLATRDLRPGLETTSLVVDVGRPTPAEQQEAWRRAVGDASPESPAALAGQFDLDTATIRRIAERAGAATAGDPGEAEEPDGPAPELLHERLWDACREHTRPQLDLLAQRIDAKATWDDLVLPAEETALLHRIADQVTQRTRVYDDWGFRRRMNRGLGITALFAGDSGTGKTMAAEVLANALRLNLYRIDLSGVVSKYIGETEKNLRRLFDAAEDGGAILFFDEADALFGKRSEVKDSHDRYANIEVNYLLQRMEAYRGLAILATNLKGSLDKAFVRRLRFILDFPVPGLSDREAIWRRAFPEEVPASELDWAHLARLEMTGGAIHNVALNAAFRAAHQECEVTMPLVLETARTELRKMDRPIHEAMFRWASKAEVPA